MPARSPRPSPIVAHALAVIEARFCDDLTTTVIARAVDRDRTYLARLFRRVTGRTLHAHITHLRVRHAAALIKEGLKIEAVMLHVGYRSKKNFYRQFRLATGLTPGMYRSAGVAQMIDAADTAAVVYVAQEVRMIATIAGILDLVKGMGGLVDWVDSLDRERRTKLATLFDDISNVLETFKQRHEQGQPTAGLCAELREYATELQALASGTRPPERVVRLSSELGTVCQALQRLSAAKAEDGALAYGQYLTQLGDGAGAFRGAANVLRPR